LLQKPQSDLQGIAMDTRKKYHRRIMRLRMTKNGKPRNAFIIEDVKNALLTLKKMDVHHRAGKDESNDLVFSKSDNKKVVGGSAG
jgi:hypothetical protein